MNNEIKYFSMFSGVGGFELGLERASGISQETEESIGEGQQGGLRSEENKSDNETNERLGGSSSEAQQCNIDSSNRQYDSKPLSEVKQDEQGRNGTTDEQGTLLYPRQKSTFTCIGMSEWDKYSNQVLKYRFPNIKNWGDCTKIRPEDLPDFDMLCGGFPCQAFSIAGKRKGFEDTRGTMFFEVARILKVKRPKTVLLENVKGLLNHDKGKTFRVILQTLDELGYEIQWMVLNSKFFGVPQNRERVLIIGNLRGERRPEILPFGAECEYSNGEGKEQLSSTITSTYWKGWGGGRTAIQQLNNPTHSNNRLYGEEGISPALNTAQGGNRQPKIRAVLTPDRPEKRQNGRRFKEDGEPSFTLTGQDIHGITDGMSIRRLTQVECCRLQGFPDDWNEYGTDNKGNKVKMSDTQRYKQMGNAVTTNVIAAVGTQILNKRSSE